MELQYFGANCVRLVYKQANIIIDDNLEELGLKSQAKNGDIVVYTGAHGDPNIDAKIIIDQPGEYEVSGVSIVGLPARSHLDDESSETATIYKFTADDIKVLVTGHIYPKLTEQQLEEIGLVDALVVPVGGNGYTLDPEGALILIKQIEPKIVIPVHYLDKAINYPVPQQDLKTALDTLGIEAKQPQAKLKIKNTDISEKLELEVLTRQ